VGATGASGPAGPAGPQGPAGILQAAFTSGFGPNSGGVSATLDFIGPTLSITIGSGQRIVANASKALGSTAAGGAGGLNIYICTKTATGPIVAIGGGMFGLSVPQNIRQVFSMSAIAGPLAAETYEVGLCGLAGAPANWNSNEFGYVSALVIP